MLSLLKSTFYTIFISGFIFAIASTAYGQIGTSSLNTTSLQVMQEFPRPNSTVTIKASSSDTDLDVATLTWTVNGKVFKKGKGVTSIDIPSGKLGVLTRVVVEISSIEGKYISAFVSFRPSDVTLLWKSDGYTPPFYKGKALQTYGSDFTVTAIPELFTSAGVRINPKTLVYTWKKNGTIDPDQSGYGKDIYKGKQTSFTRGEDEMEVLVSTAADDMSSGQSTVLTPRAAEILFYETSPLYGVLYENALQSNFYLTSEELTLHASLFDISLRGVNDPKASLTWFMNGTNLSQFANKNEIILRGTGELGGQTVVELTAQHQDKVLQGGQVSITVFQ